MRLADIVAANIRRLRLTKNLSQWALAEKTGITVSYISMLERRQRTPPLTTIELLADALDVAPTALLEKRGR